MKIAIGTAKKFVEENPDKLDVIKWVLFDDNTFKAYQDELDKWMVRDVLNTSTFDTINRMLRNGMFKDDDNEN